ncbi:MAG TPA: hypothetical protein VF921_19265 [Vicinamibacterales bacterium]
MQFGRESENDPQRRNTPSVSGTAQDPMGWICAKDPDHFRKGIDRIPPASRGQPAEHGSCSPRCRRARAIGMTPETPE